MTLSSNAIYRHILCHTHKYKIWIYYTDSIKSMHISWLTNFPQTIPITINIFNVQELVNIVLLLWINIYYRLTSLSLIDILLMRRMIKIIHIHISGITRYSIYIQNIFHPKTLEHVMFYARSKWSYYNYLKRKCKFYNMKYKWYWAVF